MIQCGYQPQKYGNGKMRGQTLEFLEKYNLTLDEFRKLDTAPLYCWPNSARNINGNITSVSRVIDKLFYGTTK